MNLLEIGRYLEDKVLPEVTPNSQLPMTVGPKTEVVSRVDPSLLKKLVGGEVDDMLATTESVSRSPQKAINTIPAELENLNDAFENSLGKNYDFQKSD